MSRHNYIWLMTILSISAASWIFARSSILPPHGPLQYIRGFPGSDETMAPQLAVVAQSFRLIEDNYVRELDDKDRQRLLEHALQGALEALDEHSSYIPPDAFGRLRELEQGHFGGIGIQLGTHPLTGELMVQSPMPDSPALRAGLRSGDIILEVDGEKIRNIEDAVRRIKGLPKTKVRLTLRPWGASEPRMVELERGDIPIESLLGLQRQPDGQWLFWLSQPQALAYIRLEAFNPTTSSELYQTLVQLTQQGLQGLILDLRGNPGGRLETAIEIAELFLAKDSPIVTVRGRRRNYETYRAGHSRDSLWRQMGVEPGAFRNLPLAILIDGQSASASEILASALQDNQRATLFGQRTFGKASVQTVIPLPPSNHALKLTTAEYLRPSGKNIHRFRTAREDDSWGVIPDRIIPLNPERQQELLLSRRLRDMLWQDQHFQFMEQRFHLSTTLFGSAGCTVDPDNYLYIRTLTVREESDPVLEEAHRHLVHELLTK
ncbi:MAG: S41 family peptidase [Gemmatales bacterium]|nr:S41 family peptidase [Gemmatales bacterium]MDW7993695.1 S41 family peptidase [Gemmatales bacterium]